MKLRQPFGQGFPVWRRTFSLVVINCCVVAGLIGLPTARAESDEALYQSMFRNAELSRVGSTKRSAFGGIDMMVLAPRVKGAAAARSPKLYFWQSQPTNDAIEFVIQERGADEPLHESQIAVTQLAGVRAVDLADLGIELNSGVEYEWSIAVIVDPERRSQDVFTMGSTQYVPPSTDQQLQFDQGSAEDRTRAFLGAGYWYDAIDVLHIESERDGELNSVLASLQEAAFDSQNLRISTDDVAVGEPR